MANAIFDLSANTRDDLGKGASRRLRRKEDRVPAIVYGGNVKPTPVSLDHKKLLHALEHEAVFSHILNLTIDGALNKVILKDLQRHPFKPRVLHIDFMRVDPNDVINMRVPIHFINDTACPGVKNGGIVHHLITDIEIRCKAKDLPEFITVDLVALELDKSIHLSEVKLPEGIDIPALHLGPQHDLAVVSVHVPKAYKSASEEIAAAATAATNATATPSTGTAAASGVKPAAGAKPAAKPDAKKDKK